MSKPKFFAKKKTKAGIYITVAEGDTRNELIEGLKRDSITYKKDKEVHDHPMGAGFAHKDTKRSRQ
tara:strand:- start:48 stop:245 length:198 start_codon:yes stop_codon:yes gene_type:complete